MLEGRIRQSIMAKVSCPVWNLVAPQESDSEGLSLPYIIFGISGATPLGETLCGASDEMEFDVDVEVYAKTLEESRLLARDCKQQLKQDFPTILLEYENAYFESVSREFRVELSFALTNEDLYN